MTWIKILASNYRQNLNLIARRSFYPHGFNRLPRVCGISMLQRATERPNMETVKATLATKPPSPSPQPPPRFPLFDWAKWVVGFVLTIVLPFWNKQWSQLLKLEGEVEMVVDAVENVAEVVEKVATITETNAAHIAEELPEDGRLKGVALWVEHVSKEAAEEAHLTEDIIHKVEELKEEMDMLTEPFKQRQKHVGSEEGHEK